MLVFFSSWIELQYPFTCYFDLQINRTGKNIQAGAFRTCFLSVQAYILATSYALLHLCCAQCMINLCNSLCYTEYVI